MNTLVMKGNSMNKEDIKEKLIKLLRDMFQFDSEDLDFGIYKIMNVKRREIDNFIRKQLIEQIGKELELLKEEEKEKLRQELEDLKKKIKETIGEDAFESGKLKEQYQHTKLGKVFLEKLSQLEKIKISEDIEMQIYNHIYTFFSRYYDKGDFISQRRYGRKIKYVVPYNGEEVYLHWATKDQYYVKTTEYFRRYSFKARDIGREVTVNFRVVEAQEEKGNVKAPEKKFFLLHKNPYEIKGNEISFFFEFRSLTDNEKSKFGERVTQEDINKEILETIRKMLGKEMKASPLFIEENGKTIIEKHLLRYTRRNTSDYFIHKNLKGFLENELDFYIKNEVLNLDDLGKLNQQNILPYLLQAHVIRNISKKIIDFLAQLENYQKKLWEKKKFVIKTEYVITLDKIKEFAGEDFLENEVIPQILKNNEQLNEWKELFDLEIKRKEDLIAETNLEGKSWKKLPIDTRYFGEEFKWSLICALSEKKALDEILDGILIKSENYQALNTILNKYYEKVQTIYIDPPFKTGQDFLYKDKYQSSSWISLMENRLNIAKEFLNDKGNIFVHLDWNANYLGRQLLENMFPEIVEIIWNTNSTRDEESGLFQYKSFGEKYVRQHDTIFQCSKVPEYKFIKLWKPNRRTTSLPIGWLDLISYPKFGNPKRLEDYNFYIEKYGEDGKIRAMKIDVKEKIFPIGDVWNDIYSFNQSEMRTSENISFLTQKPENLLRRIIQSTSEIGDIIMDYFAGSGTTLVVAHKLKRRWIGIEFADYFDEFYFTEGEKKLGLMGRLKIVLNGDKEFIAIDKKRRSHLSKDINWQGGGFFKYQVLEQYEDSLENIEFEQRELREFPDYFVKYMLDFETRNSKIFLNIDALEDPFNYKIKVIENYETKVVNVDLVETFNYLIGLHVEKYFVKKANGRKYVFVVGRKSKENEAKTLIVWRSIKDLDFKKDKEIIDAMKKDFSPDIIYVNADCGVKGFKQIESEFKALLW